MNYSHILDECEKHELTAIDPIKGRDGLWGVSLVTGDKYFFVPFDEKWDDFRLSLLKCSTKLAVWDLRRIIDWPLSDEKIIWDVKLLYGGDRNLPNIAREHTNMHSSYTRYLDLDDKMIAHGRALKTTHIDIPVTQAAPIELIREWLKMRAQVIYNLFKSSKAIKSLNDNIDEYQRRWPFIRALREVELNGVCVDSGYVDNLLNQNLDPATGRALRSIHGLEKNGFVTTLLNPIGSKTGRVRHEGGFNTLAIPHGLARDVIISRFYEGSIYTFDFNAIDYRCIVNSVGGGVADLYDGAKDFHDRTASFIFKDVTPARRNTMKYVSYVYIYGGSEETVVQRSGLTLEQVKAILPLLDRKIGPIQQFRTKLWMQACDVGYIDIPGGRRVICDDADTAGKVIGLYAQSYSSWIFEQAFVNVQSVLRTLKSKMIFAVHDEIVIDVHPDEFNIVDDIRKLMEIDGHVVKMKKGRTYGEQT